MATNFMIFSDFISKFVIRYKKNISLSYNHGKQKDTIAGECPQGAEAGRGVSAAAVSTEELP